MKHKIAILLLSVVAIVAQAKPVDPNRARQVAERYLGQVDMRVERIGEVYLVQPAQGNGFVLVSTDDCTRPVLGYSTIETFRSYQMPAHIAAWIEGYSREIASLRDAGAIPTNQVLAMWQQTAGRKSAADTIGPLLTTLWDQAPHYNALCPYDNSSSELCVTGCVATAMAQIMKYWNYPEVGRGSYGYNLQGIGNLFVNFDTSHYQWELMPNRLHATDSVGIAAVAKLMYHVGVSVHMNYSPEASGAQVTSFGYANYPSAENALRSYFRYSPLLHAEYKDYHTDADWNQMLRYEITHGRPVLYAGFDASAGHAFVLDGYESSGMFHVNWGWGGYCNGYFTVDSLSPGAGGIGANGTYTFNEGNQAVIGIEPSRPTSETEAVVAMSVDATQGSVDGNGSYVPYIDTVVVLATAAEGYRFLRWENTGSQANPMQFVIAGDVRDSAVFERVEGDTVTYSSPNATSAWHDNNSSRTEWGIRIPSTDRPSMRRLTAVQLFVTQQDMYTLRIYRGDSIADNGLVYEEDIIRNFGNDLMQWHTFQLAEPIALDNESTIWVTFYTIGGGYPAAFSRYSGNSNGSWYHLSNGWVPYDQQGMYGTWMVSAVLEERPFYVDVRTTGDCDADAITGRGYYNAGDQATVSTTTGTLTDAQGNAIEGNSTTFTVSSDAVFYVVCPTAGIEQSVDVDEVKVIVNGRSIALDNTQAEATLYDVWGRQLGAGHTFRVPSAGVYILHIGNAAHRVVVK